MDFMTPERYTQPAVDPTGLPQGTYIIRRSKRLEDGERVNK
jgi:hypothetical protein